jgi:hypothetical protein
VFTSDIRGAGTDSDVFCTLSGLKGDSGERTLDTSADNFERASEDIFFLECQVTAIPNHTGTFLIMNATSIRK